ncbi:MAG: glycosyltransferase family 2 protein [Infirmifilum sp.]
MSTKNNSRNLKYLIKSLEFFAKYFKKYAIETELVFVIGRSSDNIEKVIKDSLNKLYTNFRKIILLKDPGISLSYSRKLGLDATKGDILIFLDGDMILTIDFASELLKLIKSSNLQAVAPRIIMMPKIQWNKIYNILVENLYEKFHQNEAPPRVVKREYLKNKPFIPILSRYIFEDQLLLKQLLISNVEIKYNPRLLIFKYENPTLSNYFRKHFRYGYGFCNDLKNYALNFVKKEIVIRIFSYLDLIFPILTIFTFLTLLFYSRTKINIHEAYMGALLRYTIRLAIFSGHLKCILKKFLNKWIYAFF